MIRKRWILLALVSLSASVLAQEPLRVPRATPLTRPELKQMIEDVKFRVPRIPLPELTEADRTALGEEVDSYEARLRHHYLHGIEPIRRQARTTATGSPGNRSREQDPLYTLDNGFKVELFWIVSRVNNCQYCLGHQESKLLGAGRTDDQIARLDGDWSEHTPAQQAAYRFARKFTYEPHQLSDRDIVGLQEFYTPAQIIEMILSMSGNNSINRWKEGVAVPQRSDEGGYSRLSSLGQISTEAEAKLPRGSYLTPTSDQFLTAITKIALASDTASHQRGPLESFESLPSLLEQCKRRKPRLPLVDESLARRVIPATEKIVGPLPHWIRLIANFPTAGASRFEVIRAADDGGDLSPLTKAQLSWIVARYDRAWYAVGQARQQLRKLEQSDQHIRALDSDGKEGDWSGFSDRDRSLFVVARNLAASPVCLTDEQVASAVQHAGPRDTVQTISYICSRASFHRITEAAGLPLDD